MEECWADRRGQEGSREKTGKLQQWPRRELGEGMFRVERETDASRTHFRSRVNKTFSLRTSYREIKGKEKKKSSMTLKFGA